ncbi:MAG: hypothetical protein P9L94_07935 [Candidatus Hinthialibacter antarcticus]|nr:hypothetical protein [Candidatus Hinthialibacter antarcticus]
MVKWVQQRLQQLRQALDAPWLPYCLALLPLLLIAHSFNDGWYGDDFVQRTWLMDSAETNARAAWLLPDNSPPSNRFHYAMFELFNFADGGEQVQHWVERGVMPWWTHPELRVRFFRPLSGITHWLDYTLWPGSPFIMHLHNALWLFVMVSIAIFTFRLFLPSKVALLAGVFFALNDCLAGAAWIAGRNALLSAVFVFATLYCHHRWRTGEKRFCIAALLSFLAALLSSESGVCALAFLIAYTVFIDPRSGKKRCLSLLPYMVITIVWKILYELFGYGVQHSGLYVSPLNVGEFLLAVFQTYPALLQSLVIPDAFHYSLSIGLSIGALLFVLLLPVIQTNPVARFLLFATLLSLVPLCAHTWSTNIERLFYIPAFGVCGLFAIVVIYWHERLSHLINPSTTKLAMSIVVTFALALSAYSMFQKADKPKNEQADLLRAVSEYQFSQLNENHSIFLMGTPNSTWHFYYAFLHKPTVDEKTIARVYTLLPDLNVSFLNTDENEMIVNLKNNWTLSDYDSVWRSKKTFQFTNGQRINAGAFDVIVLESDEQLRPQRLKFVFDGSLASTRYDWRQWRLGRWNTMPIVVVE